MGGAQSTNIQKNTMSADTTQTHRSHQGNDCTQNCDSTIQVRGARGKVLNFQIGGQSEGEDDDDDDGDSEPSGVTQSCTNQCSVQGELTSIADQTVNQDLMARLTQKAQATVKGVNFGNYSDALNYMDSSIDASIRMTSEVDQQCVNTQMASNKLIFEDIGDANTELLNIDILELSQTGVNEASVNCTAAGTQYATATQKLTSITSQSAIASTTGVSGLWAFLLLLLPFIGPVCVAWGASHVMEGLGSTVWIFLCIFFVIYFVSATLTYYPLYNSVSEAGGLEENDRGKNVWNPIPYTKKDNPDNLILLPEIPFPREETLYTELKTKTEESSTESQSNLFLTPNSSIGDGGLYENADQAVIGVGGDLPIYKKGILDYETHGYQPWSPEDGDYEIYYYLKSTQSETDFPTITDLPSAQPLVEGGAPEAVAEYIKNKNDYIAFEWFNYFISNEGILTQLKYPLIVLYKKLPEYFWNWDILGDVGIKCLPSDPDGEGEPACISDPYDGENNPCDVCMGRIPQQPLVDPRGKSLIRPQTYLMNNDNQSYNSSFLNEKHIRCPSASSSSPYYPLLLTGNDKSSPPKVETRLQYAGFDGDTCNVNEENVVQKWNDTSKVWDIVEGGEIPGVESNKKIHILHREELEEDHDTKLQLCNLWAFCSGSVSPDSPSSNPACSTKVSYPETECPNISGEDGAALTMEIIIKGYLQKAYGPGATNGTGTPTGIFTKRLTDRQSINHIIDSHDLSTIDIWTLRRLSDESYEWEKETSESCKWVPKSRDCRKSEEKFGNKTHDQVNAACENTRDTVHGLDYSADAHPGQLEGEHCRLNQDAKTCEKKELFCKDVHQYLKLGGERVPSPATSSIDEDDIMSSEGICPTTTFGYEKKFDSYKTINSQSQITDLRTTLSSSWSSMSQQEKREMVSQSMSLLGDETIMQKIGEQVNAITYHLQEDNRYCEKVLEHATHTTEHPDHQENVEKCVEYCCIDPDDISPITSKNIYEGECTYNTSPMIDRPIMPYMPTIPNTTGIKMFRDGSHMGQKGSAISFLQTTVKWTLRIMGGILFLIIVYTGKKMKSSSKDTGEDSELGEHLMPDLEDTIIDPPAADPGPLSPPVASQLRRAASSPAEVFREELGRVPGIRGDYKKVRFENAES